MRLTLPLQKQSMRWLIKTVRRTKGVIRVADGFIPSYVQKSGLEIVDPLKAFETPPRFPAWEPPVKDDPRFTAEPVPSDHPDYHEKPVYKFVELTHLVEGMKQAEVLTKTHVIKGLPEKVTRNIGVVEIPRQDELVQRYIMQANIWDPTKDKIQRWHLPETPRGWKFKREFGIPKRKINEILMQNMIRLCQTLDVTDPELAEQRRMTKDHQVSSFYDYQGKSINIEAVHNFMVSSKKQLSPFASPQEVKETAEVALADLFPIEPTIDIRTTNIYKDEDNPGWLPEGRTMYPHTIVHSHRDHWKISKKNAKALMFMFSNCVAVAKRKYGPDVKVLPEPVCTQWIGADEDTLHFMCYQLNTLDFDSKDDVKNILWLDSECKLFNKILPKRAMLRNTKYEDYDPEVFAKFLAFYLTDANLDLVNENLSKMLNL